MEIKSNEGRKKRLDVKSKAGLAGVTVLTAAAGLVGVGQEPRSVDAAGTPTPIATQTPTRTVTPDAVGTRIAQLEKDAADLKKLNELNAKLDTLKQSTPTPPTATRVPADATATGEAIRLGALGSKQASIKGTATAEAGLTATPEAGMTATAEARQTANKDRSNQDGGGIPVIPMAVAVAAGAAGWANREKIGEAKTGVWNWWKGPDRRTIAKAYVTTKWHQLRAKLHI